MRVFSSCSHGVPTAVGDHGPDEDTAVKRVLNVGAFVVLMLAAAVLTAGAMRWAGDSGDPVLPDPVVLDSEASVPAAPAVTADPIEVRPAPERFERLAPAPGPSIPAVPGAGTGDDDDAVAPGVGAGPGPGSDAGDDDDAGVVGVDGSEAGDDDDDGTADGDGDGDD